MSALQCTLARLITLLYDIHRLPLIPPIRVAVLHQLLHRAHIPILILVDRRRLVREERPKKPGPNPSYASPHRQR